MHPVEGTGSFRQLRKAATGDRNAEPFQEGTPPKEVSGPDTGKKATWEVPEGLSLKGHPGETSHHLPEEVGRRRRLVSFDLLRELDRIADEFTEFLSRRERRSDKDRIYTTIGSEDELIDEDKAITGIIDSQGYSATATEAVDLGVERDAKNVGGPMSPGDAGSPLYCSVGPTYSGPLPRALCSYFIVYDSVYYDSNKKFFQVASRGSWSELPDSDERFRFGPRVLLVLDADQTRVLVSDFPVAAVFAAKARALIQEGSLSGLAFDLSLATDYDARSRATLLQATRDYMPGYHFVGLIDFIAATGLLRANLAELAGSVHKVFPAQRPTPRAHHRNLGSESIYVGQPQVLFHGWCIPDRDHVCLSVSLAVYKFNVFNLDDANSSGTPGVGSLASYVNTEFSYSQLCEELRDPHRYFDEPTQSTYVHVGKAWLGFDDDTSIEIKIDKLSRKHRVGCLLADNIDLDDFRNVCKKGDFPRLRLLKRAVLSRERR
ncbi:hypothetical protein MTO96_002987 [Rhipicephalus appendiculatus]